MIAESPDLVRKMVRATLRGIQYALENPDETFTICLKHLPELGEEQKKQEKEVLLASMAIWENEYTREKGLGRSDPEAWRESQELMLAAGLINKITPVEELLDHSFLE
jgi:NitT/TauT family transport system substrate-binding protein